MSADSKTLKLRLVHWHAGETAAYAARLHQMGYFIEADIPTGRTFLQQLVQSPPAAVVIVLDRLPSQGRDLAVSVRHQASTRHLPIVFVGGVEDKVGPIKDLLPAATFTSWEHLPESLAEAIAHPPVDPPAPKSVFAAYAGRPLELKLGLKAGMQVALLAAPPGFTNWISGLPAGIQFTDYISQETDVVIWFVTEAIVLDEQIGALAQGLEKSRLWICWPKKSSGVKSDVSQNIVRERGLAQGLVDYKVTAIDKTWSGLLFTRRKA